MAIIFINDQCTRLTGYTLEDLNAVSSNGGFFNLFHPDDVRRVIKHTREMTSIREGDTEEIGMGGWQPHR